MDFTKITNRIYLLLLLLLCIGNLSGQNKQRSVLRGIDLDWIDSANYIRVVEPTVLTYNTSESVPFLEEVKYFDHFGRLKCLVNRKSNPDKKDLFIQYDVDAMGRVSREWLPIPVDNFDIDNTDTYTGFASTIYGDSRPFQDYVYESSQLENLMQLRTPGRAWANYPVKYDYATNSQSGVYSCRDYRVSGNDLVLSRNVYSDNQLSVVKTTDEDEHIIYRFTNLQGQLVLERRLNGSEQYDTYHVYDDYGLLRYVLPPALSDLLTSVGVNWNTGNNPDVDKYAYYYEYDDRNNCSLKKLPGCGAIYMIYDNADRLVLSQDGNLRTENYWTVNRYDRFNRLLYVSLVKETGGVDELRGLFSGWLLEEGFTTGSQPYPMEDTGYSRGFYNLSDTRLLTVNYYDDYRFLELLPSDVSSALSYRSEPGYDEQYANAKGMLTGSRTYRLGSSDYTTTAYYYDKRGNVVQKRSTNHLRGYDHHYYTYTFRGKVLKDMHQHLIPGKGTMTQTYTNTYDHAERLTKTSHSLNKMISTSSTLAYDDFGRLKSKTRWNEEVIIYDYNIRGWLTGITSPNFTEKLYYGELGCYNGNIGRMDWKVKGDDLTRSYSFAYDGLDRMTRAGYAEGKGFLLRNGRYDVSVGSYDKQGNILSLLRNGAILPLSSGGTGGISPNFRYGPIDELTFTYDGNRLQIVSDEAQGGLTYKDAMDFVDGSNSSVEYSYDANGNMTSDKNKGISRISYNVLNLPFRIQNNKVFSGMAPSGQPDYFRRDAIGFEYDASGTKLQVRYETEGGMSMPGRSIGRPIENVSISLKSKVDYCENLVYENDTLSKVITSEGYYVPTRLVSFTFYTPHTYLRDHQGNVRCVESFDSLLQVNHYYPFGGLHGNSTGGSLQRYKYGGKELERMHGLDLYDFSARSQDPMIGRFLSIDPLCEKYYSVSPYVYCMNNPIKYIDPNGMDIYRYDKKSGIFHLQIRNDDNFDMVGNFRWNKSSNEFDMRGSALIDNIEKGILSDGIDFKSKNNVIGVGGRGQASVNGVESFLVNLSNMIGKEIGGAYFSKDGSESTTHISVGKYENNGYKETKSSGHLLWNKLYPGSKIGNSITGFFHTHPSDGKISVSDRLGPSDQDLGSRDNALKIFPNLQFYILTHPVGYGEQFPYKFSYTTW